MDGEEDEVYETHSADLQLSVAASINEVRLCCVVFEAHVLTAAGDPASTSDPAVQRPHITRALLDKKEERSLLKPYLLEFLCGESDFADGHHVSVRLTHSD